MPAAASEAAVVLPGGSVWAGRQPLTHPSSILRRWAGAQPFSPATSQPHCWWQEVLYHNNSHSGAWLVSGNWDDPGEGDLPCQPQEQNDAGTLGAGQ